MVVLASSFLDTSLVASQDARRMPLVDVQRSRISPPSAPAASLQNTEEQHVQRKRSSSPASWISFFLSAGASQKAPRKPLLEDMDASQASATAFDGVPIAHEPAKISPKKGPKGVRRVTFTSQKARELREKLKGTDSFHDFMYHSAIASRLASHDS